MDLRRSCWVLSEEKGGDGVVSGLASLPETQRNLLSRQSPQLARQPSFQAKPTWLPFGGGQLLMPSGWQSKSETGQPGS